MVRELKTPKELAQFAYRLASGQQLVRYHNVTYIPADYETDDVSVPPDPDRTIWRPLRRPQLLELVEPFDLLFRSDGEMTSFEFMLAQHAVQRNGDVSCLLVKTEHGLKRLDEYGKLTDVTGEFVPNTLVPLLNEDAKAKAEVFGVVSGWLDSDEEAESLLTHLATCLAPSWSAVRYVLLLGEGRNGKSLMLKMVEDLFGADNASHVTRQDMMSREPAVLTLLGKLVNIVYDGQAVRVKDSAVEKSLTAGEPVGIHKLYVNDPIMVWSNALFLEGLNREPRSNDQSMALQKRLVRFRFGNVYDLNHPFERHMRSTKMLGALLSLLIDRYVIEDQMAERLRPTAKALALSYEAMHANSLALQFFVHLDEVEPLGVLQTVIGMDTAVLAERFRKWRQLLGDFQSYADTDVLADFSPLITTERVSRRVDGKPRKVRVVTSLGYEAAEYIKTLKGDEDDAEIIATLVDE